MQRPAIYAFSDEASPMMAGQIAAMLRNGLAGPELRGVDGQSISDLSPERPGRSGNSWMMRA